MTLRHVGFLLLVFTFAFLVAARIAAFFMLRYWRTRALVAEELALLGCERDLLLTQINRTEVLRDLDRKLVRIAELKAQIDALNLVIKITAEESAAAFS